MAKVKSGGLRNLIGRVGGNVYYMNKGQNIARELAPAISNPQTAAQQEQRMRWANLVAFYRANQPWQKRGAFESKKQTWSDYNAFVSANSKVSPVYLTKQQAEQGGAVVAPYIVTKGSLPSVAVVSDETNEQFVSDLYVGDLVISGTTTAAELSAALRANNNNLQEGDQLSFILNLQGTTTDGVPYITARYYEFIIDSSDSRTLANLGLEGVIVSDTWNNKECLCLVHGGATCGGAIIVSRTTSGNIKVGTQGLILNAAAQTYLAGYTSDAALQRAARSYGENEANFLASGYSGKASNVAVPTGVSVLTLAGAVVGSAAPRVTEDTDFVVTLSSSIDSISSANVKLYLAYDQKGVWGYGEAFASAASVNGNSITLQTDAHSWQRIYKIEITTAGGDTIVGEFVRPEGDVVG